MRASVTYHPLARNFTHTVMLFFCAISVLGFAGCYATPQNQLLGKWVGKPDSEAAKANRLDEDAAKKLEKETPEPTDTESSPKSNVVPASAKSKNITDWEQYKTRLSFDFVDSGHVVMSAEGEETIKGTWHVVTSKKNRLIIEVRTPDVEGKEGDKESPTEIRRFVIRYEGEDFDRFTLVEDGADLLVGSLIFYRQEK